jgi:hypothetical protein
LDALFATTVDRLIKERKQPRRAKLGALLMDVWKQRVPHGRAPEQQHRAQSTPRRRVLKKGCRFLDIEAEESHDDVNAEDDEDDEQDALAVEETASLNGFIVGDEEDVPESPQSPQSEPKVGPSESDLEAKYNDEGDDASPDHDASKESLAAVAAAVVLPANPSTASKGKCRRPPTPKKGKRKRGRPSINFFKRKARRKPVPQQKADDAHAVGEDAAGEASPSKKPRTKSPAGGPRGSRKRTCIQFSDEEEEKKEESDAVAGDAVSPSIPKPKRAKLRHAASSDPAASTGAVLVMAPVTNVTETALTQPTPGVPSVPPRQRSSTRAASIAVDARAANAAENAALSTARLALRSGKHVDHSRARSAPAQSRGKMSGPRILKQALMVGEWATVLACGGCIVKESSGSPVSTVKQRLTALLKKHPLQVSQHSLPSDGTGDAIDSSTVSVFLLHVARYVQRNLGLSAPASVHQHVSQCLTAAHDVAQTADGCMESAAVEAIATGSLVTSEQKQSPPLVSIILRHLEDAIVVKEGAAHPALALLKELSCDTDGARALLDLSIKPDKRTCLQVLMDALKRWRDVPATVSDILSILWELLWFDRSGAAPAFAKLENGRATAVVASVIKSYLHVKPAEESVQNALGVLFQLDDRAVFRALDAVLFGGSVHSVEEVTCLVDAVFEAISRALASYSPSTLPSLVTAMKVIRSLLPSVVPFLSARSQLQHAQQMRKFLVHCAASSELEAQAASLCEALLCDYTAAVGSAGGFTTVQPLSLMSPMALAN